MFLSISCCKEVPILYSNGSSVAGKMASPSTGPHQFSFVPMVPAGFRANAWGTSYEVYGENRREGGHTTCNPRVSIFREPDFLLVEEVISLGTSVKREGGLLGP